MVDKIRILQLIYSFDVEGSGGGLTRFVFALSQALDPQLFDVTICALWNTGATGEERHIKELTAKGVHAFTAADWNPQSPLNSLINSFKSIRAKLYKSPVDIIHSHSEFSDILALLLKYHPCAPLITRTLHNGFPIEWRKRPIRRYLLSNMLYPLAYDGEIGVAKHVVANLDRRWLARIMGKKATLLHNAIDLSRFIQARPRAKQSSLDLGIPDGAFVAGTVGRLREEKGYRYLLEAAAQLIEKFGNEIYFVIVGAGDLEEPLRQQAKDLNIDSQVIFTGSRDDIELLLSGMDVFICSSLWEGFSTAVLEAMAAGVPVIATDIPGNRELIQAEVNGWIVPPADPAAIAHIVQEVRSMSEAEREKITQAAFRVASEYSITTVAQQHAEYYLQVIKNKKETDVVVAPISNEDNNR